jgi:ligand-binding sensor domain-containing protein
MRSSDGGSTWLPADDGLSGHYIHDLRRDEAGVVYAAGDAGVYQLDDSGRWQHIGLPRSFATFLFAAPWGDLYLGTDNGAAYRSQDRGASWRPLLLPHERAGSMTVTKRRDLLLASEHGVVRSRDRGDSWEQLDIDEDVRTIFTVPSTGVIVAGTTNSVFRSVDDGVTWVEHAPGAEDVFPESFADGRNGDLFVGTAGGDVYRVTGVKEPWHQLPLMHDGSPVSGLAVLANGDVLAGTIFGLSRWKRGNAGWEQLALSREEKPRVASVILDANGNLVVATSTAGVFISSDQGRTWRPANRGLATRRSRRMVLGPDGELYIAAGTDGLDYGGGAIEGRIRIYKGRLVHK